MDNIGLEARIKVHIAKNNDQHEGVKKHGLRNPDL